MPYVFAHSKGLKVAADQVLAGRRLHLAHDFDGAAWDMYESMRDILKQLECDNNILTLPADVMRTFQFIFDGHGWNSRTGAVRFVLRCTQTKRDHNSTRNARDPIFFLGDDKHLFLEKAMSIGEAEGVSMSQRMYAGLRITEWPASEMPAHVQADVDFLPLACISYAGSLVHVVALSHNVLCVAVQGARVEYVKKKKTFPYNLLERR
jgi:hypothetical protein